MIMIEDIVTKTAPSHLVDHSACPAPSSPGILYEKRPTVAEGLFNAWIVIDNPKQFNSYSVDMLKALQQAFRTASEARDVVAVVLTGSGEKAFCTGGDAMAFATYYAGNPQEFRRFMRLFDDTVSTVLTCDKPVICRVNGLRSGGGQELGLACDLSVAHDLAQFGQAGPKHGGAMVGGATDFLPAMIGAEEAMAAGILCDPISAHKARRLGMISGVVPALHVDSGFVANPLVVTERVVDEFGEFVLGERKTGDALRVGKELLARGRIDLSRLDAKVGELCAKFLHMSPESLSKTLEELRRPKLEAWNRNKEANRAWAAVNMATEGHAGFKAFAVGNKEIGREVNFVALRQAQAAGKPWTPELIETLMPRRKS